MSGRKVEFSGLPYVSIIWQISCRSGQVSDNYAVALLPDRPLLVSMSVRKTEFSGFPYLRQIVIIPRSCLGGSEAARSYIAYQIGSKSTFHVAIRRFAAAIFCVSDVAQPMNDKWFFLS